MTPMLARPARALALLAVALLTTACGLTAPQKADVHAFSRSAIALADIGRDEFIGSRDDVVDMNRRRYLLGDPAVKPDKLDGLLSVDVVQERLLALEALADYGQALTVLLGTADAAELQTAANSLVDGLGRMDALALESPRAAMISKAITSVGGILVEAKRRAAIEEVVNLVHDDVMSIADLVSAEFDVVDGTWAQAYELTALELRGALIDVQSGLPLADRRNSRLAVDEGRRRFMQMAERVQLAAEQLAYAQENLRVSLQDPQVNRLEIQAFRQMVTELTSARDVLAGDRSAPTRPRPMRPTDPALRR